MNPLSVLFFGPQGAGKGTQVKLLIDFLEKHSHRHVLHIDMGQELRKLRDTGTYAGKLVGEFTNTGRRIFDFMPIYLQTKMMVENFTGEEHVVADGLARGPEQTHAYDTAMKFFKFETIHIIDLVISDDTAVKRLLARGRDDDTEEAIRKRLEWTKSDVMPQLEYLRSQGHTIHTIDGEADVDTIHKNILAALSVT